MSNILLSGIDTFFIGFYLQQFKLNPTDWVCLEAAKEAAKAPVFTSSGYQFNFRGIEFVIKPAGKRPYSYILLNDDFSMKIAKKVSSGKFPEIFIEMRSQFLWRFGYEYAVKFVRDWLETWSEIARDLVNRADLTIDLLGYPEININMIISRARTGTQYCKYIPFQDGEIYYYASVETGRTFGTSPLMMRIYDKTLEIKLSHKEWFYDLWAQNGWDRESQVARVEMEMQREFLKDFDVTTFASFKERIGDIFRYLTGDWFTLRVPLPDTNCSRWPVTPFWSEVQGALDQFGKTHGLKRGRIKEVKKEVLLPMAAGIISSIAALSDDKDYLKHGLNSDIKRYLRKRRKGLNEIINEKKKRHAHFEDCRTIDLSGDDLEILP